MFREPASVAVAMAARGCSVLATRASRWVSLICGFGAWTAVATPLGAQALTSIEFSFSNPGARSLGLGGAFVALADDATAAFANPAGLVQIARPEVSAEVRAWSYSTPYTAGGRAFGPPTGLGIDVFPGPLRATSEVQLSGVSFLAYVYPKKRWSLALFRHQLANFEFSLETQGLFGPGQGVLDAVRSPIQASRIDLEILTQGMALALRPTERLSLGVGLTHFDMTSSFIGWDYLPDDDTIAALFTAASLLPNRLVQIVDLSGDDTDVGFAAGLLWRPAPRWSLGTVYRQGPSSRLQISLEAGLAHPQFPAGFRFVDGFPLTWNFPDVTKLGVAYRSGNGRWTGAFELKRVEYSSILASFLEQQRDPGDRLDNADEIHLGGEYAFFAGTSVLAIRFGAWHDPDHQIRSEADPNEEPYIAAILPAGKDQTHLAAGIGFARDSFQVDLGIDLSERIDTVALSAIYSF